MAYHEPETKCIHRWRFVGQMLVKVKGKREKQERRKFRCEKCKEEVDARFTERRCVGGSWDA